MQALDVDLGTAAAAAAAGAGAAFGGDVATHFETAQVLSKCK